MFVKLCTVRRVYTYEIYHYTVYYSIARVCIQVISIGNSMLKTDFHFIHSFILEFDSLHGMPIHNAYTEYTHPFVNKTISRIHALVNTSSPYMDVTHTHSHGIRRWTEILLEWLARRNGSENLSHEMDTIYGGCTLFLLCSEQQQKMWTKIENGTVRNAQADCKNCQRPSIYTSMVCHLTHWCVCRKKALGNSDTNNITYTSSKQINKQLYLT